MKIYNPVYGKEKYFCGGIYGPTFSGFYLYNNLFSESGNIVSNKKEANEYFSGFSSEYELNGGERNFITQELEVFQIVLDWNDGQILSELNNWRQRENSMR